MAKTILIVDGVGEVSVFRKRGLKNIRLSVNHNGEVRLSLPWYVPKSVGAGFVKAKRVWIIEQKKSKNKKWEDGDSFHGFFIKINVSESNNVTHKVSGTNVKINIPKKIDDDAKQQKIKLTLEKILKNKTENEIVPRAMIMAKKNGLKVNSFKVKKLRSRWGSCDSDRNICFSSYMSVLPEELQDYVIFHEFAHTKKLNHSADFWEIVKKYVPDYKQRKKALAKYSPSVFNMQ